jgi:deazaflavin-dependent oxidoreductase (nitroreductase family)
MADMQDFNTGVIEEFRANEGQVVALAKGRPFEGIPMLLLHHRGARTHLERVSPLVYQTVGDSYAVFATKGGAPTHPVWYGNLMANPDTQVEIGTALRNVTARELDGNERKGVWERQKLLTPVFADYEDKTKGIRHIPVVLLERRA